MVIYSEVEVRRASIWNTCVKVLQECLEDYLKFSDKKKLFQTSDKGLQDDSARHQDLIGLADVLGLMEQILSLRSGFLVDASEQLTNDGIMLREKLFDNIQKKHLRAYREDWSFVFYPAQEGALVGQRKCRGVHQEGKITIAFVTIQFDIIPDHCVGIL